MVGGFNVIPDWKSSFTNDVSGALPAEGQTIKSPYAADALATMNHLKYTALGQIEFIPLSGKIAILSSLFSYFDFYVLGGAGVVNLAAKEAMPGVCDTGDPARPKCKAYTATQLAINAGRRRARLLRAVGGHQPRAARLGLQEQRLGT